jgi:hypothetical protein
VFPFFDVRLTYVVAEPSTLTLFAFSLLCLPFAYRLKQRQQARMCFDGEAEDNERRLSIPA